MRHYRLLAITFLIVGLFACDQSTLNQTLNVLAQESDPYAGMVLIPAGAAELGAPASEGTTAHQRFKRGILYPKQTVFVDAFYMDTHEVTIAEFQAFVDAVGYEHASQYSWNWFLESTPEHPVFASYGAAKAYAAWAGKRLPTDFEWEKAARGGLVNTRYPWGDDEPTIAHAHFMPDNGARANKPYTVPVGSYPPNAYGLYDMAGNVEEWVIPDVPFTDVSLKELTPTRGGSWFLGEWAMRVYARGVLLPHAHSRQAGFRCVKDVSDEL